MIRFAHKVQFSFMFFVVTGAIATNAMEKSIQIKKEDATIVNCFLMLTHKTSTPIMYAPSKFHAAILEHSNLHSTIKDPVVILEVENNASEDKFSLPLPLKYCYNLTDWSPFQITETEGTQLFRDNPLFKNKPLLINALCVSNPELLGYSFEAQMDNAKKKFYKNPGIWIDENNPHELEDAHIVIKKKVMIPLTMLTTTGRRTVYEEQFKFDHGPNGCSNEETFLKPLKEKCVYLLWILDQLEEQFKKQHDMPTDVVHYCGKVLLESFKF